MWKQAMTHTHKFTRLAVALCESNYDYCFFNEKHCQPPLSITPASFPPVTYFLHFFSDGVSCTGRVKVINTNDKKSVLSPCSGTLLLAVETEIGKNST